MISSKLQRAFGKRIGFFGTDDFSVAILKKIHQRRDIDFIKVFTTGNNSYKTPQLIMEYCDK